MRKFKIPDGVKVHCLAYNGFPVFQIQNPSTKLRVEIALNISFTISLKKEISNYFLGKFQKKKNFRGNFEEKV